MHPPPGLVNNLDRAVVLFDHPADDREPEAGALRLAGVETLRRSCRGCPRARPGPFVGDVDLQHAVDDAARRPSPADRRATALSTRFDDHLADSARHRAAHSFGAPEVSMMTSLFEAGCDDRQRGPRETSRAPDRSARA